MNIYLSHSSADTKRAQHYMDILREYGHTIAYNWIPGAEKEQDLLAIELRAQGRATLQALSLADALIVVFPLTTGCLVEIGVALAHSVPVHVVGRFRHFFAHMCHHHTTLQQCLRSMDTQP